MAIYTEISMSITWKHVFVSTPELRFQRLSTFDAKCRLVSISQPTFEPTVRSPKVKEEQTIMATLAVY